MPINGVLDLQRRSLPLGEIRIGQSEPIPGKSGRKPVRRETFRFTTPVEETANAIAAKLGGKPEPWDRRRGYWVVDTNVAALDVWVPPRGLAVDAWMELWEQGKCKRRCDGITEQRSGQPCMCPQPEDRTDPALVAAAAAERKRLAAAGRACKPLTRLNLAIPWLPGAIGVWRLNTGSANAAVETADTGEILEKARAADVYVPAQLLIHWRPGQDGHPYPVPVLRPRPSAEQLAQLPSGMNGMLAQLHAGSDNRLALTAGATAPAADEETPAPASDPEAEAAAQKIADDAANATTREEVSAYAQQAKRERLMGVQIQTPGEDDTYEDLHEYLDHQWRKLLPAEAPRQPRRQQRANRQPDEAHAARPPAPAPEDDGASLFDDPNWAEASR